MRHLRVRELVEPRRDLLYLSDPAWREQFLQELDLPLLGVMDLQLSKSWSVRLIQL